MNDSGVVNLGLALGLEKHRVEGLVNSLVSERHPSNVASTLVVEWYHKYPEGTIYDVYKGMERAKLPAKVKTDFIKFWLEEDKYFKSQADTCK